MKLCDYLHKVIGISNCLCKQEKQISDIIDILKKAKKQGKHVFLIGLGGSLGTASHMTCDLFKISKIKAISLCDNIPLITAITNDNGFENIFVEQLQQLFLPGDVLIAFSVHGCSGSDKVGLWSQNVMKAIQYVKQNKGITIGFCGFDGGAMKKECDISVIIPAETTPLVESFHVVLHHYIAFELQEGNRI
jgi:D-sedoheptulose 7-phosphate isomerase